MFEQEHEIFPEPPVGVGGDAGLEEDLARGEFGDGEPTPLLQPHGGHDGHAQGFELAQVALVGVPGDDGPCVVHAFAQPVAPGEFFWVDLYTTDTVAAAAAYAYVGYKVVPAGDEAGNRMLLESRGYARAGITPLPADARQPGWLPYVQVDDVAATLASATAAGGKVLLAPDPALLDGNVNHRLRENHAL